MDERLRAVGYSVATIALGAVSAYCLGWVDVVTDSAMNIHEVPHVRDAKVMLDTLAPVRLVGVVATLLACYTGLQAVKGFQGAYNNQ